jgi:hypothetical protein
VEHFRFAGGEPVAQSPDDRICVIAWQGHRGEKLHFCEDAQLMASELNREWPSIEHWAAPATADEIRAHAAQAAHLMARASASRHLARSKVQKWEETVGIAPVAA